MGNSEVLGRLLSSTLLHKQGSSGLELRKVCHSECLCAGWLCAGVVQWCFDKHLRSLK